MQATKIKITLNYFRTPCVWKNKITRFLHLTFSVDHTDVLTNELLQQHKAKFQKYNVSSLFTGNIRLSYFSKTDSNIAKGYAGMSEEELDNCVSDLLSKNKDGQIIAIVEICGNHHKFMSENTLKRLFRSYSVAGKPDVIAILQKYCSIVDFNLYKRNGEFMHYLAKAHCFKGNADRGLSILSNCYKKYDRLRGFYRIIFRELIQDTVLNRSEASLVIFKKYVLEFSNKWDDNYPLVCFWHLCWSSTWFSDQMLASELLETSESLQSIVKDKAATFCINILREYNDDAVVRLLQELLKYKIMSEYTKVLQVLFNYKLRNRDLRGCMEIIRNCEALGVSVPADQQGRYIRMLIDNKMSKEQPTVTKFTSNNFKLKF